MHLNFDAFKAYAKFSGRASRSEFWTFALICSIIPMLLFLWLIWIMQSNNANAGYGIFTIFPLIFLYGLFLLIPSLAVTVRRLHDINCSTGWVFIAFVPGIGPLILLILMLASGTLGDNKYGPNPVGH